MMETILRRRSIRRFQERPVEDGLLQQVLRAAMQAPSAKNERPWEFLVVQNPVTLQALSQTDPYSTCVKNAPMAIVLLCNRKAYLAESDAFWQQDMAAAAENTLLAAHSLGLGATWLAVAPLPERMDYVTRTLELPEGVLPFALIPLGYPLQPKAADDRYDPSRIHYEAYPKGCL